MKKKLTKEEKFKELQHKSRRHSIKEGFFAQVQTSLGANYISPFAIAINASNSMVALLGSLIGLLGPLSQLFSSRLMEKYSRKSIILRAVLYESLMWIPFIIIGILFAKGTALDILPLLLVITFSLQIIIGNTGLPAWFSWIGDIVDKDYRGRWFAKRNLLLGFVGVVLAIISSFFLDYFKKQNLTMEGFIVLFILAMIGRLISWKCFKNQYEPKIKLKKGYYFSFWDFLINSTKTNFGKFCLYRAFLSFTMGIASPLFVVYLLRILEFSYTTYMVITMAGTFFSLLFLELWGKIADKYGNYNVIILTSFIIPTIPILWILSESPIYLLIPSIIGAITWAGFLLSSGNFVYDNVSIERRGLIVSYYNMLIGIGIFLGAGLGAILIKYIDTTIIRPIIVVIIISAILRTLVVIFGLSKIKEVRKTKKFHGANTIKNIILKEAKLTIMEEAHQIMSIKRYIKGD